MSDPEFTVHRIKRKHASAIQNLERQELLRLGATPAELRASLVRKYELEQLIQKRSDGLMGVSFESELIGFTALGPWTSAHELPFAKTTLERKRLAIKRRMGRFISYHPLGIHRMLVDQDVSQVLRYRTGHSMLGAVTDFADSNGMDTHVALVGGSQHPLHEPVEHFGFVDTGARAETYSQLRVHESAKYVRTHIKRSRGQKIPSLANILALQPRIS